MISQNKYIKRMLVGHSSDVLKTIPRETFYSSMTSPPYYGVRSYQTHPQIWDGDLSCVHAWGKEMKISSRHRAGEKNPGKRHKAKNEGQMTQSAGWYCLKCSAWKGELGTEPTFELYLEHLWQIFDEVLRVTRSDGTCWVNIGDTYAGSGGSGGDYNKGGSKSGRPRSRGTGKQSLPRKCLMQLPSRFSIGMVDRGWTLRQEIVWSKESTTPESAKDRFCRSHEMLYFFSKSPDYYFQTQYEKAKSYPSYKKSGFKYEGKATKDYDGAGAHNPSDTKRSIMKSMEKNPGKRIMRTVWSITPNKKSVNHHAAYPVELTLTPIRSSVPVGEPILDVFMGSGTTAIGAEMLKRTWTGIELRQQHADDAVKRVKTYRATRSKKLGRK